MLEISSSSSPPPIRAYNFFFLFVDFLVFIDLPSISSIFTLKLLNLPIGNPLSKHAPGSFYVSKSFNNYSKLDVCLHKLNV